MQQAETTASRGGGSGLVRCPACGQRLATPAPSRCPLCELDFGDDRATGVDLSPYAQAYLAGELGWFAMCKWVWFAGAGRLNHLARMRSSAASRQFLCINLTFFSLGLALFQTSQVGWRWVSAVPAIEPTGSIAPRGGGWRHVAETPRPLPPTLAPESYVDLWWNPSQMVIAMVGAFVGGWFIAGLAMLLLRWGMSLAHLAPLRREQRMTAALHYSSAWLIPLVLAAGLLAPVPLAYIGAIARWSWHPPRVMFEVAAGAVAALTVVWWWFWMLRLGSTAPPRTRGRVSFFVAAGAPLILTAAGAGWWFGLNMVYEWAFSRWRIVF